jgi:hypothetical protein
MHSHSKHNCRTWVQVLSYVHARQLFVGTFVPSFRHERLSIVGKIYVPLLCGKALKRNYGFAMGPLGAGRRRSGQIPANRRPRPAGRGRGRDPGSLGADSLACLGRGGTGKIGRRRPGTVAAATCRAGEVGAASKASTPASLCRCKGRC